MGKTIRVRVSFTDDADNAETRTSEATEAVVQRREGGRTGQLNPATGAPAISGTPQVGETNLTASTSDIADQDGLTGVSYRYQWIVNDGTEDADIDDATDSTYTPSVSDVGKTIRVRVSFTDGADNAETRTSEATEAVAAAAQANNPATGAPAISGTPQVGETLTASTSDIADQDGLTSVSYRYQWLAGGYGHRRGHRLQLTLLTSGEEGQTVQVKVSFTDDDGQPGDPDQRYHGDGGGGGGGGSPHRQRDGRRPGDPRRIVGVHL